MAGLIKQSQEKSLKRAKDATRDPADLVQENAVPGVRIMLVPLADIDYNPRNVRDEDLETDPETLELAASFKVLGQQQPAVLVPREVFLQRWPDEADRVSRLWVAMAGNRRRAAHKLNGTPEMECIVRDRLTPDMLESIPIHENLHRKGINPLKLAYWLQDRLAQLGNERAVADEVGKSQGWVNHTLKLLKLIPELQAQVKTGKLSAKQGRTVGRLSKEEQQALWERIEHLTDEQQAEFWVGGAWRDRSTPVLSDDSTGLSDSKPHKQPDEAAPESPPHASQEAAPQAHEERRQSERPAIVIKLMQRDTAALAEALRERLSTDEFIELREAMNQLA